MMSHIKIFLSFPVKRAQIFRGNKFLVSPFNTKQKPYIRGHISWLIQSSSVYIISSLVWSCSSLVFAAKTFLILEKRISLTRLGMLYKQCTAPFFSNDWMTIKESYSFTPGLYFECTLWCFWPADINLYPFFLFTLICLVYLFVCLFVYICLH